MTSPFDHPPTPRIGDGGWPEDYPAHCIICGLRLRDVTICSKTDRRVLAAFWAHERANARLAQVLAEERPA